VSSPARLRRAYFDCRYGQLHVHQAIPPGGGFDEAAPLLCIPGREGSARVFRALLGPLGADRSIYAPDLPGCGESDSAGAGDWIATGCSMSAIGISSAPAAPRKTASWRFDWAERAI
jgi:pimeloyl-ACP methyl ester carboxylesterase